MCSTIRSKLSSLAFIALLVSLLIGSGCAGSGGNSITPDLTLKPQAIDQGISKLLWGFWNISIDPATLKAEITPLRGIEFNADVTRFMQPPISPTNMVSISIDPSSEPSSGHFVIDVTVRHPFPGLNQYNGFDVRGIFMADGSLAGMHDSTLLRANVDESRLLNPDGYTRWWNWPEFLNYGSIFGATEGKLAPPVHPITTVNPYKYFHQDLDTEDPVTALDPASRGFFPTNPGIATRRYDLQFAMDNGKPVMAFNYAVDASWFEPDHSYSPDYPQEAFPLSANCQEAFNVDVKDAGSTAYFVDETDNGGEFVLDIEVFDWQGGANNDVPGEVNGIWLEGDVLGAAVDVFASATVLPGTTVNSAIYEITVPTGNLTASGDFEVFGTVENKSPNTYQPQIDGGDAFVYADTPLAAYFVSTVTVQDQSTVPPPTITGIVPDEGIPDCTPEHVVVSGTDFLNGATFRLEKTGQTAIEATDVEFVDANTLEGDFLLTGAAFGAWDVVVENPGGASASLPGGFTVLDVLFVDGDNTGDPSMDGSETHPFDTIQKGINAAANQGNKPVIVDQCTTPYSAFALKNNSHVIGCNWNDGVGWPTVNQTNSYTYGNNVSNATIEGMFFDITISSGSFGMNFSSGDTLTLRGCKFSGVATTEYGYFVHFYQSSNVEIDYCEFTQMYQHAPDAYWRDLGALYFGATNGVHLHHSEIHDIGYDIPDAGEFGNSINVIRVMYEGSGTPHNVDFHNLLVYNIFDKTDCIRPSPNPDPQNALSAFFLGNVNSFDWVGYLNLQDITVDDLRHADPPESTIVQAGHVNAAYMAMIGGDERVWKNNIASNIIPTDDSMWPGNSSYFGWWVDNYVTPPPSPQPMDYSDCFNIGKPLPPGANSWQWTSGYINQCQAGVGSYQNFEDIDPEYDMTPGSNFYHPTNPLVSEGGDDGGEMGAFGGPEGDWIPPSQVW